MELFKASKQWANRPDDERFWSLEEMHAQCFAYAQSARTALVGSDGIRMIAEGDELIANGRSGAKARLTNYAFGQMCRLAQLPPSTFGELPAEITAQAMNHRLALRERTDVRLLLHVNGDTVLRAATSEDYARLWNHQLVARIGELPGGWRLPPARYVSGVRSRLATESDVLRVAGHHGLSIKVGDRISPSGAYASDRDMFVFMVDDEKRIEVNGASLCRGFFAWNSEVGDKSFGIQTFRFDSVCGNHIVWGARDVKEIRLRHTKGVVGSGEIDGRWVKEIEGTIIKYANASTNDDVALIERAQRFRLAATKDELIDRLFEYKALDLSRKTIDAAYQIAETTPRYGDPKTAWGFSQGLTELSQKKAFTEDRVKLDRTAGKILEMAF